MTLKRDNLFCAVTNLLAGKEINTAKFVLQHKQGGTFIISVMEWFGLVGFISDLSVVVIGQAPQGCNSLSMSSL